MTLPASGTIKLSQVNTELGLSASAQINMGRSDVRNLFEKPSGTISLADGYGKSTDPYINNVSLLLRGDGTNGGQNNTFLDSSPNNYTVTRNGDATQGSVSPFGSNRIYTPSVHGASAYFNKLNTTSVNLGGQSSFAFSGNFTIELWFNAFSAGLGTPKLYESRASGQEGNYPTIQHSGTTVGLFMNSATRISATFSYNTWNHIALVRNGSTITMYLNGVSAGTYTNSSATLIGASRPMIAAYPGFDGFDGCISDIRVLNGTALYTSNFTRPSSPLTSITNTQLLLNFSNASIYDMVQKSNLQTVGNVQISTSVKKYGTGSIYFDGNGDYLKITETESIFDFGTGDFTVEAWIYVTSFVTDKGSIASGAGPTNGDWMFAIRSTTQLSWGRNHIVWDVTTSGFTFSVNTWYHVAACRSGTTLRIFVNGTAYATATNSQSYNIQGGNFAIGARQLSTGTLSYGEFFTGYIDDLRITKGIARYTSNFTPPSSSFWS